MAKTGQPQFGGLHFWVRDLNATLAFYRAIGLDPGEPEGPEAVPHEGGSRLRGQPPPPVRPREVERDARAKVPSTQWQSGFAGDWLQARVGTAAVRNR